MKNKNVKFYIVVIVLIIIPVLLTVILRWTDVNKKINISGDAWLEYIGNMIATITAIIGLSITIYKLIEDKEIKDIPTIVIKKADVQEHSFTCINKKGEYTQSQTIYIEIINKGNNTIKFPQIKNSSGIVSNILKDERPIELDLIEPANLQTDNKYIIRMNINYFEGMSTYITEDFEFICTNMNNDKYSVPFEVEMQRYKSEEYSVYQKEIRKVK